MKKIKLSRYFTMFFLGIAFVNSLQAAKLWSYWDKSNPNSTKVINFQPWQPFLDTYVVKEQSQTYLRYSEVTATDKSKLELDCILNVYADLNILDYNRNQQLAFWTNILKK
ncbi:hypothetical protein IB644_06695 [Allofrancisella guangzhouensis]|nr:hypothetical protein [Allofrancisella guangzhouensis]MBK2046235.1 hypothetical protein [Allofrancisella guangzhouensis]